MSDCHFLSCRNVADSATISSVRVDVNDGGSDDDDNASCCADDVAERVSIADTLVGYSVAVYYSYVLGLLAVPFWSHLMFSAGYSTVVAEQLVMH